jgi:hypothetical protein
VKKLITTITMSALMIMFPSRVILTEETVSVLAGLQPKDTANVEVRTGGQDREPGLRYEHCSSGPAKKVRTGVGRPILATVGGASSAHRPESQGHPSPQSPNPKRKTRRVEAAGLRSLPAM